MSVDETESRVAREVAENEFARCLEAMDIDVDPTGWDDDDKRSFEEAKRKFVAAVTAGHLTVDEQGQPVYTPRSGATGPITFHEPTGASLMAMDQKKKNHDVAKMYAAMADMTKQPITRFVNMSQRDLRVCTAIAGLFLAG